MGRIVAAIGFGALVVIVLVAGFVRAGPDAPVASPLVPWLDDAREVAQREAGLVGFLPTRFVEARCTSDGRTAILTFQSVLMSAHSVAVIGFPSPEDWDAPGATVVIGGYDESDQIEVSTEACARVPTGQTK